MNKILERRVAENELLHKELELLAEESVNCRLTNPQLLAGYATAMCAVYTTINSRENELYEYVQTTVGKREALELAETMESLFEPFSESVPEYEKLKELIAKLKQTL